MFRSVRPILSLDMYACETSVCGNLNSILIINHIYDDDDDDILTLTVSSVSPLSAASEARASAAG